MPPGTQTVYVTYGQKAIPDQKFHEEVLLCGNFKQSYNEKSYQILYFAKPIPQLLNISQFDSARKCSWEPYYPMRLCSNSKCGMESFGYPSEFKLAIFIPSLNKVFITNEILRSNFNADYKAELYTDGSAKLTDTTFFFERDQVSSFTLAFLITIALELLTTWLLISRWQKPKKILLIVLFANIISLPFVWFFFPLLASILGFMSILISEIFAVFFEAYFIYFVGRKTLTLGQSMRLSLINNLVSVIIGMPIFLILTLFTYIF
ncbi:MAG: hypothetical protein PHS53_00355 [Candidatus Pacebacteria bacterium]|nr:hypothetical protein [Candidatus Paceibacterota bacterium]MDD5356588.1 hypothetical protein [Candidatus Paceibacterota bacterium]